MAGGYDFQSSLRAVQSRFLKTLEKAALSMKKMKSWMFAFAVIVICIEFAGRASIAAEQSEKGNPNCISPDEFVSLLNRVSLDWSATDIDGNMIALFSNSKEGSDAPAAPEWSIYRYDAIAEKACLLGQGGDANWAFPPMPRISVCDRALGMPEL